jgi:hypothetical protein
MLVLGQLNFFAQGLHIGGEVGPAFSTWSGNISTISAGSSSTALNYGPEVGYDFPLSRRVSLGAEAHYLLTNADGGVNSFQFLGALKVWL